MQLLLEAALCEKPRALRSWKTYLERNDLQTIDHAATTLLPLVYRNLKEESHPTCKSMYRHTWAANQTFWAKTVPTLQKLVDGGIEKVVLLKGMALILDHYQDFGVRIIGDIDILIDRAHLPLAHSILLEMGWHSKMPWFNPHNPHQLFRWNAANFLHPSGLNLDLHWSLLLENPSIVDDKVLEAAPTGIGSASPTDLLFQTCIHGYKKSTAPLIRWIPDALTLLRKSEIDFSRLFHLAEISHLTLPLSEALSHLSNHFGASIPPFHPKPSSLEIRELRANLRGYNYLAGYYRSRIQNHSFIYYLQHTKILPSPWLIPLYAPYWVLKRLYRLFRKLLPRLL